MADSFKQLLQQTKANTDEVVAEAMLDIDAEFEALCASELAAA